MRSTSSRHRRSLPGAALGLALLTGQGAVLAQSDKTFFLDHDPSISILPQVIEAMTGVQPAQRVRACSATRAKIKQASGFVPQ